MKQSIKSLLIVLMLIMGTMQIAGAQSSDVLTTIQERVRLRYGPGLEWAILGYYEAGTPMRLDGQAYAGQWVRGILPDGQHGWVINTAVAISQEQAAQLNIVWVDDPFTLAPPGGGAAPAAASAVETEEAAPAAPVVAPQEQTVSGTKLFFSPLPGPYTMPLPGLDASDPVYEFGFRQWDNDDGRTSYQVNLDGLAVYCVNQQRVPEETYRNGGIQVKGPNGEELLYAPVGTILAGYQSMLSSGQNTLLATSERLWYGNQLVSLYMVAPGGFQLNFVNSFGNLESFTWIRCRPIPRDTNDNCPPGWDRHPRYGDCVHADFD